MIVPKGVVVFNQKHVRPVSPLTPPVWVHLACQVSLWSLPLCYTAMLISKSFVPPLVNVTAIQRLLCLCLRVLLHTAAWRHFLNCCLAICWQLLRGQTWIRVGDSPHKHLWKVLTTGDFAGLCFPHQRCESQFSVPAFGSGCSVLQRSNVTGLFHRIYECYYRVTCHCKSYSLLYSEFLKIIQNNWPIVDHSVNCVFIHHTYLLNN